MPWPFLRWVLLCLVHFACGVRPHLGFHLAAAHQKLQQSAKTWTVAEDLKYQEVQNELLSYLNASQTEKLDYPKFEVKQRLRDVLQSKHSLPSGCQLSQLLEQLIECCEKAKPKNWWVLYKGTFLEQNSTPFGKLPEKNCSESAADIFLYGNDLVQTLRIPEAQVWKHGKLPWKTLLLVQSFWFLRQWLVPLATSEHAAILWAGFWNDSKDPTSRNSKEKLFDFAKLTDHQTVHPATRLGTMIENAGDLDKCYSNEVESDLTKNMWSFVSMCFVIGMQEKEQSAADVSLQAFFTDKFCGRYEFIFA